MWKLFLASTMIFGLSVPAAQAGFFDNFTGPNITVEFEPTILPNPGAAPVALEALTITNVDKTPITINSVDINNGSCKAIVRGSHTVKTPRSALPKSEDFEQGYEVQTATSVGPCTTAICKHLGLNQQQQSPAIQHYRLIGRWCLKQFVSNMCNDATSHPTPWQFDHPPTQADIEAKAPGQMVEDTKEFGNVTLAVGQKIAIHKDSMYSNPAIAMVIAMATGAGDRLAAVYQCPQGVDVVRVTVDTDKGAKTFEVK